MKEINKCTYCDSQYGIEREHVIPVSWYGFRAYDDKRQWLVPACRDCNKLAGSKLFFSIPDKASYLYKRYRLRFRKVLSIPYWSPQELSELDRNLRESIESSIFAKVVVQQRLKYIESVSNYDKGYMRPKWVEILFEEYKEELRKKLKKKKSKRNH